MSSDLERRLEGLLAEAPEPDPGAGEKALHRALQAVRPVVPPRRGLRTAVLVFAAAVVLLVIAAGALATAGALHVTLGPKPKPPPVTTPIVLPRGANGIAAVVNGRLSVVTKNGFRLQGFPVSAATLSPRALYVAAGVGKSLVAMRPNGRQAWAHPAGGRVVAIAWAPDAIRIAYVVQTKRHFVLHVIWGTGTHDKVVDREVRPVTPSWRADSVALAYVGAGGRAILYDLGHEKRQVVPGTPAGISQVAFAPTGSQLAVLAGNRVFEGGTRLATRFPLAGMGWLGSGFALIGKNGELGPIHVFGRIDSFQSNGHQLVVVVAAEGEKRVLAGTAPHLATVLRLPPDATVETVVVR
jgi:hypothetical protein